MAWLGAQHDGALHISALTAAEIRRGILGKEPGRRRRELEAWSAGPEGPQALFAGRVPPFDERAALELARLMAEGTATGRPRSGMGMVVAAMAAEAGLTVATVNGRHPRFDRAAYRRRSLVERPISRLKRFRRIATRHERRAANRLAMVRIAVLPLRLQPSRRRLGRSLPTMARSVETGTNPLDVSNPSQSELCLTVSSGVPDLAWAAKCRSMGARRLVRPEASGMTFYETWIGPAVDPSAFVGGRPAPALGPPERLSPLFPDGRAAFFELRTRIDGGALRGRQVDWGSWAALATRAELEAVLAAVYGPPGVYEARHAGGLEHLAERLRALRGFVADLPRGESFILVCEEY